jgi:hypothetical protein
VPTLLGRKERIENPVADRLGNPDAGVDNLDHDIITRTDPAGRRLLLAQLDIARRERQISSGWHGIPGVDREVDQRRTELGGIDQRRPGMIAQIGLDIDLSPQRRRQQFDDLVDQRIDVDLHRAQRLLPGKGEQVCREFCRPIGDVADQLGDRREPGIFLDGVGKDFDRAGYHREHVC